MVTQMSMSLIIIIIIKSYKFIFKSTRWLNKSGCAWVKVNKQSTWLLFLDYWDLHKMLMLLLGILDLQDVEWECQCTVWNIRIMFRCIAIQLFCLFKYLPRELGMIFQLFWKADISKGLIFWKQVRFRYIKALYLLMAKSWGCLISSTVTKQRIENVQVALGLNTVITIARSDWLAVIQCKQRRNLCRLPILPRQIWGCTSTNMRVTRSALRKRTGKCWLVGQLYRFEFI